jgi:deoxyribonucleoside regulator
VPRVKLSASRWALLAEVASLYYDAKLDQENVAERMGVSRSTVSRMLSEAQDAGVVQIRVNRLLPLDEGLQLEAVRQLGIREVLILAGAELVSGEILSRVGMLAARYLDSILSDGASLAIGWGTAVRAVTDGWEPGQRKDVNVIQMIGGVGSSHPEVDGPELARRLAGEIGGTYQYLNAPLVVEGEALAVALRRQPSISSVLDAAARAQAALVGIGSLDPEVSSLLRAGYLNRSGIDLARKAGAVGDVCGHHLDGAGNLLNLDLDRRTVGISIDALRKIPLVVGVAIGQAKTAAILAAVRSQLVNVIVTDSATMRGVLDLNQSAPLSTAFHAGAGRP